MIDPSIAHSFTLAMVDVVLVDDAHRQAWHLLKIDVDSHSVSYYLMGRVHTQPVDVDKIGGIVFEPSFLKVKLPPNVDNDMLCHTSRFIKRSFDPEHNKATAHRRYGAVLYGVQDNTFRWFGIEGIDYSKAEIVCYELF